MYKYLTSLAIFISVVISGCRTDGGDIGYLYGEWALQEYTVDGQIAEINNESYYFLFQGNILFIKEILPHHDFRNILATWNREGEILSFDFTQTITDPDTGNVTPINPPADLGIPEKCITDMHIDRLTDKELILSYTNSEGIKHRYILQKVK